MAFNILHAPLDVPQMVQVQVKAMKALKATYPEAAVCRKQDQEEQSLHLGAVAPHAPPGDAKRHRQHGGNAIGRSARPAARDTVQPYQVRVKEGVLQELEPRPARTSTPSAAPRLDVDSKGVQAVLLSLGRCCVLPYHRATGAGPCVSRRLLSQHRSEEPVMAFLRRCTYIDEGKLVLGDKTCKGEASVGGFGR